MQQSLAHQTAKDHQVVNHHSWQSRKSSCASHSIEEISYVFNFPSFSRGFLCAQGLFDICTSPYIYICIYSSALNKTVNKKVFIIPHPLSVSHFHNFSINNRKMTSFESLPTCWIFHHAFSKSSMEDTTSITPGKWIQQDQGIEVTLDHIMSSALWLCSETLFQN